MMQTKRWQLASLLTLALMALLHAAALADEASEAAGENKETMWDLITNGGLIMIPLPTTYATRELVRRSASCFRGPKSCR